MPIKRRQPKSHTLQVTWETLTPNERAWLLGEPLDHEPFGEQWGFDPARGEEARDVWRPGRPTGAELLAMFGDDEDEQPGDDGSGG